MALARAFIICLCLVLLTIRPGLSERSHLGHRELIIQTGVGYAIPTNDWHSLLDPGITFDLEFGVAPNSHLLCGFTSTYSSFPPKRRIWPRRVSVGDHDWKYLSGGLFAEYAVMHTRHLAPFVALYGGMQGIWIDYVRDDDGFDSQGDHGFSLGFGGGVRAPIRDHIELSIRVRADTSPAMHFSGWFPSATAGLVVIL